MNLPPVHTKKVNPLIHPLDIRVKKLCGFENIRIRVEGAEVAYYFSQNI